MGGSTQQATSKSTSEPWSAQQPYIKDVMSQAQNLYKTAGPSYYPNSTVAPFSADTQQALSMGRNIAANNGGLGAAEGYNNNVLSGQYLNNNPYNDAVFQNVQSKVMPAVNSMFEGAGRYGSGSHATEATNALTNAYAPIAQQQYNNGLQQMDAAANRAPGFAQADWQNANNLNTQGQQVQQLGQNEITDAMNRYNYYQDLPAKKLAQYAGFTGGNYGSTTTSSQPYYQPSIWSQIGGAGLGLAGLLG